MITEIGQRWVGASRPFRLSFALTVTQITGARAVSAHSRQHVCDTVSIVPYGNICGSDRIMDSDLQIGLRSLYLFHLTIYSVADIAGTGYTAWNRRSIYYPIRIPVYM